ncbi:hypothetical protein [Mesobacillus subterraneus]|uniref:hypothetical protein n=1 Tax=Mesobacillus subterraneus TaxID=285983 RepID=UPI000A4B8EC0|nr:hypothetical protein [Mesobacillus subterraneus]
MIYFIWAAVFLVSFYSILFSVTLWKQNNKPGSIAIFLLSLSAATLPYFTLVK